MLRRLARLRRDHRHHVHRRRQRRGTLPIWIFTNLQRPNQLPIVNVVAVLVVLISIIPVHLAHSLTREEGGPSTRRGGSYQPDRDALGWIRFCIEAHISQASRRLEQIHEAAERWERLERKVEGRGWPDRFAIALEQSLIGGADRAKYGEEAGVSPATASADLRRLLDSGLIEQQGRGRTTRYWASERLRSLLAG